MKSFALSLLVLAAAAVPMHAGIFITEVAPWSSGDSPVGEDWFEVTNTGSTAVNITGWKMDDSSDSFSSAVALNGITSIGADQSVIFIELNGAGTGETAAGNATKFIQTWFGGTAPVGLQIGSYGGSGVGLSTGGDAVNLFNASGVAQAGVTFGASPTGPFETFDNSADINGAISTLSKAGVNGAFVAAGDSNEIGSPGAVTAAVPEPSTIGVLGLGIVALVARRRMRRN